MTTPAPISSNHPRAWLILALILCAEIMDLLDGTIVNVAAPSIARDLGSGSTAVQWMTGGYSLTFAVFLIAGARLGDRYGRRTLFLAGAWGFVACSALCAAAPDTATLITGRLLQGVAAALLIPQGLSLLLAVFAPADQGKAFAIFGPAVGLAAVAGPVLGGVLVDADLFGAGWRLVFLINLPIGILAALGAGRLFPQSRLASAPRLDVFGILLAGVAVALVTYPLVQGREAGWPAWSFVMIAGGLATLGVLVPWTRGRLGRHRDPLIQLSVFRHRGFAGGVLLTLVFFGGTFGVGLALTLFLQLGLGYSAIHAGLTALPYALGSSVGALAGGAALVPRLGRGTLQLGNALQAVGLVLSLVVLSRAGTHVTTWELAGPLLVWGLGMGLVIAPLFDFALAGLDADEAGSGSGLLNALQQLGTAVGVAALGTVFFATVDGRPGQAGYVTGLERCLQAGLGISVLVGLLTFLLPRHARDTPDPENTPAPTLT
ncbi:DHA2 family efflux MFS transporter permease subunit [Actinoplanes sp. RD1]|uniref:DHA2 family efflux MFS transporter permease subunit n=1 Tax=Actinoplanes sp. RD1 TaxID=3064538 RepID=UPI002741015C|nr:DHA2 family efflux MFS transporter permease subunit [Actinoplanes sp. RD1]